MIPRNAEKTLLELAQGYPLVGITGPRQSGKTTLARHLFKTKPYISLENPDIRELAQEDPRGFLKKYHKGAVFDEIQRAPELLSFLQEIVDTDNKPGRFIITGSQQFGLLSGITQSLAGRIALVQLLPFSYNECYTEDRTAPFPDELFFTGLYPPVHDRSLAPGIWYGNYVQTYIERDVRQMVNIKDLGNFQRFLKLCAGRTGQLLNLSGLAADCGITHNTAKSWISILEASYILFLLRPHYRNYNKRLIKSPKLYFYDTGLLSWLLSIRSPDQLNIHSMRGPIFESFIISETVKSFFNKGLPHPLYFWRDRSGNEIDLLIEHGDRLQPVEIKSGQTLNRNFFKGVKKWMTLAGPAAIKPTLIYGGDEATTYNDIDAVPWHSWVLCQGWPG